MKVLIFHPTLLPPRDYGGVERVVLWLAKGLLERGHEVWVGALPGSQLPEGVHLHEVSASDPSAASLFKTLPRGIDLVHFMAPPEAGVIEHLSAASLLTVHGNGKPGEKFPLNTVFLSQDHARRHHASAFVHNGIDPEEFRFSPADKQAAYLFLSKTSWKVKNLKGAMGLCRKARAKLWIAGGQRPWSLRAKSFLMPSSFHWWGAVRGAVKADLLARAKALVFPVLWSEPFGLVVAEALVSGTPVLASPLGSLPELVSAEVGALPASEEEWLDWLRREKLPWDPERCRQYALDRFHYRKMTERYEGIYKRVCTGEKIHTENPHT